MGLNPQDDTIRAVNSDWKDIFEAWSRGQSLTREQSRFAFTRLMSGELSEALMGALAGALLVKGASVEELVGAAEAMRAGAIPIRCEAECIDTCGTGGDGISTFNVSTTAAIIAAAAGATVAKHGNRSTTRASGSTEVLTELGIDVEAQPAVVLRCLAEVRIGYLNAKALHPAMGHAAAVRKAIPVRTVFNLLGPLTNPAGARRQVLGVPSPLLVERMAEALVQLGSVHAWVVHGHDGLCDLTITGPTQVAEVRAGTVRRFTITPESGGLGVGSLEALRVSSAAESAAAVTAILQGERGVRREHALLNAGAAVVVAGLAEDLGAGVEGAARAIDSGAAWTTLERWRAIAGAHAVPG